MVEDIRSYPAEAWPGSEKMTIHNTRKNIPLRNFKEAKKPREPFSSQSPKEGDLESSGRFALAGNAAK